MITEAAILKDGIIYHVGKLKRHCDIILSKPLGYFRKPISIHGFIDEYGKFYSRREAADHAYQCGQIKNKADCLISEDLW